MGKSDRRDSGAGIFFLLTGCGREQNPEATQPQPPDCVAPSDKTVTVDCLSVSVFRKKSPLQDRPVALSYPSPQTPVRPKQHDISRFKKRLSQW